MSWEEVSALSAVGTLVVISATAIAALVQLRHMQNANALNAIFGFMDRWMTREFQERAKYIFGGELDDRLKDPGYRQRLMHFADPLSHPESGMLDFWDQAGSVVKSGLVSETGFMESGEPQSCVQAWKKLAPVVAIMRRTRGEELYANFEWLAARTTLRLERQPFGYPKGTPRMATRDPFPEDLKSAGTS